MRYVLENIEIEALPAEMKRHGIAPRQRVRVVVETLQDDVPLAQIAEQGGAFDFLADEPDMYSAADLRQRNV